MYGRTLNLPPVIVLIAVLSGAELLGITGVLLALPLAAAGRVALDYVLDNRSWLLADLTDQPFAPDPDETGIPDQGELFGPEPEEDTPENDPERDEPGNFDEPAASDDLQDDEPANPEEEDLFEPNSRETPKPEGRSIPEA